MDEEVAVLGKLSAGGVTKTVFGGSSITRARETGEPVSISDDLKAGASDALKKACSLLGIGLELYSEVPVPAPERGRIIGRRDSQSAWPLWGWKIRAWQDVPPDR